MKRSLGLSLLVLSMSASGALAGWGLARYRLAQLQPAPPAGPVVAAQPFASALPAALAPGKGAPRPALEALVAQVSPPQPAATHQQLHRIAQVSPVPLPRRATVAAPAGSVVTPARTIAAANVPQAAGIAPAQATDPAAPADGLSPPLATAKALKASVLIVVSIPSQRIFVFKDGEPWASSRVSTGKPGKSTPTGTFTILEKKVRHRSTLYGDAPMPYMQRLTWGGVALHAGHVPGYRASHGCIRLPRAFARKLYSLTDYDSTRVVVTKKRATSAEQALEAA